MNRLKRNCNCLKHVCLKYQLAAWVMRRSTYTTIPKTKTFHYFNFTSCSYDFVWIMRSLLWVDVTMQLFTCFVLWSMSGREQTTKQQRKRQVMFLVRSSRSWTHTAESAECKMWVRVWITLAIGCKILIRRLTLDCLSIYSFLIAYKYVMCLICCYVVFDKWLIPQDYLRDISCFDIDSNEWQTYF